jgi:hypothetical protein
MQALRAFLGENDMMASLTMMANRQLEMQRVFRADRKRLISGFDLAV